MAKQPISNKIKTVWFILRILADLKLSFFYTFSIFLSFLTQQFIHKKILIAPLDWGLGHATRCIPLIRYLHQRQFDVLIACQGEQEALLRREFPNLRYLPLKGYSVRYAKTKWILPIILLLQLPKMLLAIRREHRWLRRLIREQQVDLVISDNRYGLHARDIPAVFITHQLQVKAPFRWTEWLIQHGIYRLINKFSQCWVPDFVGELNIAGKLSHPDRLPLTPVYYIGPLSRFTALPGTAPAIDYLFLISGPEPQRSLLEEKVYTILDRLQAKVAIVRGKPTEPGKPRVMGNATIYHHLESGALQALIQSAKYIVGRPGYTSVMEILALRKKAILIPTPGQTEQEYLGHRLMQQQWCFCCSQDDNLIEQIKLAAGFEYRYPDFSPDDRYPQLDALVEKALGK